MRTEKLLLISIITLVAALVTVFPLTAPARADQDEGDGQAEIALDVSCPSRHLVIDVKHKVVNDGDSGVTRYWAYDAYKKHIQVWQTGPTTFCVVVQYDGKFTSTAGPSPMGTDSDGIVAGITGTMTGGYRATITGALNPNPAYKKKGNLGTFDYGWNGDPNLSAPNRFDWVETYFQAGNIFDFVWWGWAYNGGEHGIWFNTAGNGGDITD